MVRINSVKKNAAILVGAAALGAVSGANAAAIPAGQGQGNAAILDIEASVLRLPDAMPQRTFALPEHAHAKREWRGRKGKRGPWRTDHATDLINLDLGNGPHDHQGSLLNIETVPHRHLARHHDEVVVVDHNRHGLFGHDRHRHGDVLEVLHKRRHDGDVIIVDGHDRHGGGRHHHHHHGDRVEVIGKRRHGDDVVVVDDYQRHRDSVVVLDGHRHHGHYDHHEHGNVHSHIHAHGDNVVINEKRRSRDDTVVVAGGRHSDVTVVDGHGQHGATVVEGSRQGTTIVDGGRHGATVIDSGRHRHDGVTVVGRDVIDMDGGRHGHNNVIVVDGHGQGHNDRHSHRRPVTVVTRSRQSDTEVDADGQGSDIIIDDDKHEPTARVGKRHSSKSNTIIVDGSRGDYYDRYYRYPTDSIVLDRPGYYGRGDRYGRVRVIEDGHFRHRGGRYKRSHDNDRHERHGGGRHCHHGHCHDDEDVTVVTKRDNGLEMGGAPGYIDVTSAVFNSTTAQRIASLVLSTTNGTESDSSFVLNASNNIRTQVYLVPANSTAAAGSASASVAGSKAPIKVNLKLPIFVAQSASVEPYCATFDPEPKTPGPLYVTKCLDGEQDPNSSQVFLYDPATGIIHPEWNPSPAAQAVLDAVPDNVDDDSLNAQSADTTADEDDSTVDAEAITTSSTTSAGASSSSTSSAPSGTASAPPPLVTTGTKSSTDSTSLDSKASNVTLVFTPVNPSVNQSNVMYDDDDSSDDDEPTANSDVSARSPRKVGNGAQVPVPEPVPDVGAGIGGGARRSQAEPEFGAASESNDAASEVPVGARDYGFPYSQDDDAYYGRSGPGAKVRYDAPYDAREPEYEAYEPYEPYGEPVQDSREQNRADWTAPYDWRWTKSAETTTAPSAEATFA